MPKFQKKCPDGSRRVLMLPKVQIDKKIEFSIKNYPSMLIFFSKYLFFQKLFKKKGFLVNLAFEIFLSKAFIAKNHAKYYV